MWLQKTNRFQLPNRSSITSILIVLISSTLLSGCGLVLRDITLGQYVGSVAVIADQSPLLDKELTHLLDLNEVDTQASGNSDLTIRLASHEFQKSASLVVPRQGLLEYELTLDVVIEVTYRSSELSEILEFSTTGRVRVNSNRLLSTSVGDRDVRGELTKEIASQIVRYLRSTLVEVSNVQT